MNVTSGTAKAKGVSAYENTHRIYMSFGVGT